MVIFCNRQDIFDVLFGQDKQNFLKNGAIIYSNTPCFEGLFAKKTYKPSKIRYFVTAHEVSLFVKCLQRLSFL